MKRMPRPRALRDFITCRSCAASVSVSTAVGSSKMRSRALRLSTSRAISTNCMWPTGSPATGSHSSTPRPTRSSAARASRRIAARSRVSSFGPARRDSQLGRDPDFPVRYVERGELAAFRCGAGERQFLMLLLSRGGKWQVLEPALPL